MPNVYVDKNRGVNPLYKTELEKLVFLASKVFDIEKRYFKLEKNTEEKFDYYVAERGSLKIEIYPNINSNGGIGYTQSVELVDNNSPEAYFSGTFDQIFTDLMYWSENNRNFSERLDKVSNKLDKLTNVKNFAYYNLEGADAVFDETSAQLYINGQVEMGNWNFFKEVIDEAGPEASLVPGKYIRGDFWVLTGEKKAFCLASHLSNSMITILNK